MVFNDFFLLALRAQNHDETIVQLFLIILFCKMKRNAVLTFLGVSCRISVGSSFSRWCQCWIRMEWSSVTIGVLCQAVISIATSAVRTPTAFQRFSTSKKWWRNSRNPWMYEINFSVLSIIELFHWMFTSQIQRSSFSLIGEILFKASERVEPVKEY